MRRLLIIGGDAAGMAAAGQARRLQGPDQLEIVAFERGPRTSYTACGLPYLVAGEVADVDRLVVRTPAQFASSDIDARVHHEVTAIDLDANRVQVHDLSAGTSAWEGYDELVLATGASGVRPDLDGIDSEGIHELRTIDDGLAVDAAITAGARRAVVVGSGYIGIEAAEGLLARGLEVSVIEAVDQPMGRTLDADTAAVVEHALRSAGIDLHLGTEVQGFEVEDGRVTGVTVPGGTIPADLVLLGLGIRPNVAMARRSGIQVGDSGGIVVDDRQHTPTPRVWAAGDCAECRNRITGASEVVALGTHANKQGRVIGINIGGGDATFDGVLGTAVTRFRSLEIGRTGLGQAEAEEAGFDALSTMTESTNRAGYLPDGETLQVKLVADRGSGRLLGGQIVGGAGAAKRIDVVATAVWNDMTVEDFLGVDLSYAPPFGPTWDPVLVTARKLTGMLGRP